jgi:hypothetical protein
MRPDACMTVAVKAPRPRFGPQGTNAIERLAAHDPSRPEPQRPIAGRLNQDARLAGADLVHPTGERVDIVGTLPKQPRHMGNVLGVNEVVTRKDHHTIHIGRHQRQRRVVLGAEGFVRRLDMHDVTKDRYIRGVPTRHRGEHLQPQRPRMLNPQGRQLRPPMEHRKDS